MSPLDLRFRHQQAELMDQPGLERDAHLCALSGLRRINWWSRSALILWPHLVAAQRGNTPLRVLDIASGGGDIAVALALRARRSGMPIQLDGCDLSDVALEQARALAERHQIKNVRFFQANAIHEELPGPYDVIMCSLFLHHLDRQEAVELLRRMGGARHMLLVNDLRRTRFGYALACVGTRLLSRSRIVHVDGPLSVAGAWSPDEALALAREAGLDTAAVTHHWPQRFLLTWKRRHD